MHASVSARCVPSGYRLFPHPPAVCERTTSRQPQIVAGLGNRVLRIDSDSGWLKRAGTTGPRQCGGEQGLAAEAHASRGLMLRVGTDGRDAVSESLGPARRSNGTSAPLNHGSPARLCRARGLYGPRMTAKPGVRRLHFVARRCGFASARSRSEEPDTARPCTRRGPTTLRTIHKPPHTA